MLTEIDAKQSTYKKQQGYDGIGRQAHPEELLGRYFFMTIQCVNQHWNYTQEHGFKIGHVTRKKMVKQPGYDCNKGYYIINSNRKK